MHATHPEVLLGVEVLSDEVDELGLAEGTRRLAAACTALLTGDSISG